MAVAQGYGKTVTSGSVFAYDTGDIRNSYIGEPTANLLAAAGSDAALERSGADYPYYAVDINSVVQSNWSAGNNTLTISFEGKRDYAVGGTGGGGDGYPVFYVYFTDWSWAATLGITSYDWTTNSYTFTMPNPSGKYVYFSIYHMNAGNPGKSYSRKHQIEFKPHKTQFTNGTRSATQGLLPLVGNSSLDLSGTSFNSNAQIAFDGTDDYITIGNFTNKPTTAITCEAVIKPTKPSVGTSTHRGGAISSGNSMYLGIIDSTDGGNTFSMHWANQTNSSRVYNWNGQIPNNQYSYLVGTYDGTTARAYLNGVEIWSTSQSGTIPDATYYIATYGGTIVDGTHNFNGEIPVARIYNRALSAEEVRQNYLHYKTRFNLS